jgi:protease I
MSSAPLKGIKIAMLATDGFEQIELTETKENLEKAGATVEVIAPLHTQKKGQIRGWKFKEWGDSVNVDRLIDRAKPEDYAALVLPGGVINPDRLRLDEGAVEFVRNFAATGKPVAAICHGPQILINAELVRNKQLTSWPSLRVDLINAGGKWKDAEVIVDGQLITSRKPEDIPAFSVAVIAAIGDSLALPGVR